MTADDDYYNKLEERRIAHEEQKLKFDLCKYEHEKRDKALALALAHRREFTGPEAIVKDAQVYYDFLFKEPA